MTLYRRYLKEDSDNSGILRLKEITDAEQLSLAAMVGEYWANNYDSTQEGNLAIADTATTNADSIGYFIDTYYLEADAAHMSTTTQLTATTRFKMQTETYGGVSTRVDLDRSGATQNPLISVPEESTTTLKAKSLITETQNDAIVDDLITKIFENDLPGVYFLADSGELAAGSGVFNATSGLIGPDSDLWVKAKNVTEIRSDGDDDRIFNIYQKVGLTPGSVTSNLVDRNLNLAFPNKAADTTFVGVDALSERDFAPLLASVMTKRLSANHLANRVGKLVISRFSPGIEYRQLGTSFSDRVRVAETYVNTNVNTFSTIVSDTFSTSVVNNFSTIVSNTFANTVSSTFAGSRFRVSQGDGGVYYRTLNSNFSGTRSVYYSGTRISYFSGVRVNNFSGTRISFYSGSRVTYYQGLGPSTTAADSYNLYVKVS